MLQSTAGRSKWVAKSECALRRVIQQWGNAFRWEGKKEKLEKAKSEEERLEKSEKAKSEKEKHLDVILGFPVSYAFVIIGMDGGVGDLRDLKLTCIKIKY